MATVAVSQLKTGEKLIEEVNTPLGSVLFQKGKHISQRDVEILRAFLVKYVVIEGQESEEAANKDDQKFFKEDSELLRFHKDYKEMVHLLKQTYSAANAGRALPLMELRNKLVQMIELIEHFKLMSFTPKNMIQREYVYHSSIMVSLTSYTLAGWAGMQQRDLVPIALAGLLHNIGTVKVDPDILTKPGRLTAQELEEMRKHTVYGYNLLKNVAGLNDGVKLAALQHHEKEDGSGYPLGVPGSKIHIYAKIVAVADIFHAMTNNRTHQKAQSPYLVLEQLYNESFGKLDPVLVQTFINKVTSFSTGTIVRLSDNRIGEIVFSERTNPTRPWVNVNGTIINLSLERSIFIQEVIKVQ